MAVALGVPTQAVGSNGSISVARPADLQDGDILILAVRGQEGMNPIDWTVPTGFTRFTAPFDPAQIASRRVGGIWWKVVESVASEPASYVCTGPAGRSLGVAVRYVSTLPGDLEAAGAAVYGGTSVTSGVVTQAAWTLAHAPAVTLLLAAAECTAGISHVPTTLPAGFTAVANFQTTLDSSTTGTRSALWFGYREEPDTFADGFSVGWSGAAGAAAYSGALSGGEDAAPVLGLPVKLGNGADARLSYLDGAGTRKTPKSVNLWLPGIADVDTLLATPGATWAHRGGSANWPEMSEYAYDHSVYRGYGVLEFSAGRTSDGWWFGLHDDSTDRTSGGTFGLASAQTKAQVQAQQIVIGASGAPQPYFGMTEFLQKYGQTHILVMDLKYAWQHRTEFFDILQQYVSNDRLIFKTFGPGQGAADAADDARARGILSWGFFYQEDYDDGDLNTWQSHYDMLGMNIGAPTAWTGGGANPSVLSYGKPVVGHIANTQVDYDAAITKGAQMVQCSNVAGIAAVR